MYEIRLSTLFFASFAILVMYVLYTFVASFFAMVSNYQSVVAIAGA